MRYYRCVVCGHILSEEDYASLPDSVGCPECGVSKEDYELVIEQNNSPIAQLVEQQTVNLLVPGSSPGWGANNSECHAYV